MRIPADVRFEVSEKTRLLSQRNSSSSSSSFTSSTSKSYGSLVNSCQLVVKSLWRRNYKVHFVYYTKYDFNVFIRKP